MEWEKAGKKILWAVPGVILNFVIASVAPGPLGNFFKFMAIFMAVIVGLVILSLLYAIWRERRNG
ncbi:MAG: hypothetical protein ACOY93_07145 [Bacillota bacterium]